jgi:uncharacterized Zn-binding protein involved in type VI secretion
MMRRTIVVGDAPACGGRVLPYTAELTSTIQGHPVALIGGRVYCEGCHSVGIIAKAGGPRREAFISEVALEGDVVVCHCPKPPPLISTLQTTSYNDDGAGTHRAADVAALAALSVVSGAQDIAAAKKVVDAEVVHPPEAEQTERICPNMTNKAFATLVMELRDTALGYITERRLPELERWDKEARARVATWFGTADGEIREYLHRGLTECARVLRELEPRNFVRFVEGGKLATCVMGSALGTVAAVCKSDTASHTIAINIDFCTLAKTTALHGMDVIADGDSQLLALIHEVTHFNDTFGSDDPWYGTRKSRAQAAKPGKQTEVRTTADNIAAYVLGVGN